MLKTEIETNTEAEAEGFDTRIYAYGCRPPITDSAQVEEQMRLQVEFQRDLVRIERERRDEVERVMRSATPAESDAADAAERAYAAAAERIKMARSTRAVKAPKGDEDASEEVREAKREILAAAAALKAAREVKRAARKAAVAGVKGALEEATRRARERSKHLYNASEFAGLAWGTKLKTMQSAEMAAKTSAKVGSMPKMPEGRDGSISVQIQGGMSWEEAIGCEDTRLRLQVLPRDAWMSEQCINAHESKRGRALPLPQPGSRKSAKVSRAIAWLRVGSEGRSPVWAKFPVVLHRRPLPGAKIKWASVHRRRTGPISEWQLLLTLNEPSAPRKPPGEVLAVNLGWRRLDPESLSTPIRVAMAVGSDGYREEVLVPDGFVDRLQHAASIRSIRDRLHETAKQSLEQWVADRDDGVPDWFAEATDSIALWRNPARLHRLLREWQLRPFEGDAAMREAIAAWAKKNDHLRLWETCEPIKAQRMREDYYRCIAKRWAARYSTVAVTAMDLRDFAEEPAPEEGKASSGREQRLTRNRAAPSVLRSAIKNACGRAGASFEERKGPFTQTCMACGAVERFDARKSIERACASCGDVADQDVTHCRAMLASLRRAPGSATAVVNRPSRWEKRIKKAS